MRLSNRFFSILLSSPFASLNPLITFGGEQNTLSKSEFQSGWEMLWYGKNFKGRGEFSKGHIILQDVGPRTAFRNIEIPGLY